MEGASPAPRCGRSRSFPLRSSVVLCCQARLFVPSPPHLPYNRLTVPSTHSSGHSAPPLAKNTRPKKLLSHRHPMKDGEETFPMWYWAFSGISLWGWSISLAPTQATGSCCQLTCSLVATLCGRLGVGKRASSETLKDLGWGGGNGGEQNGHIQEMGAVSPARGLGGW